MKSIEEAIQRIERCPDSYTNLARELAQYVRRIENENTILSAKLRVARANQTNGFPLIGLLAMLPKPADAQEIDTLNTLIAQSERSVMHEQARIRALQSEVAALTHHLHIIELTPRARLRTALKKARECIGFLNTVSRPSTNAAQRVIRKACDSIDQALAETSNLKRSEKHSAS